MAALAAGLALGGGVLTAPSAYALAGIVATNNGAGPLTVSAPAVVTETNGDGINATNSSNGSDLTVTATDVSGSQDGIDARNAGSGALTVSATGPVTGSSGFGIIAENYINATGDISITVGDVTGGLRGVTVNNNGSGALTITSTGVVTGQSEMGIRAINGLNSTGELTVYANNVNGGYTGIDTRNYGSGGITVTVTGNISASDYGIFADNNAAGTDLTISAVNISAGDTGIEARNDGTGSLGILATGDISGTGAGISARNSANGRNLVISVDDVVGNARSGIYAINNGTGAVNITATGTVSSASADGIFARNYNNGSDFTVSVADVNGGNSGIDVHQRANGFLSVTSTGTISGNRFGITANTDSMTTDLNIAAADVTGGEVGIRAIHQGYGALSVRSTGAVTGATGHGIDVTNGGTGTNLTISANDVIGDYSGIYAINNGTGILSVTTSGAIRGGTGAAIQTNSSAGRAVVITLLSTSSVSSTSGAAILDGDGDAVVTINAGAVVNGSISLGDGNDTLNIMAGASLDGVTSLDGGSGAFVDILNLGRSWDGVISGWETINLNPGGGDFSISGAISGAVPLTKTGTGTMTLTGVNTFTGGTTISQGTLIGNTQSFGTGNIVNNASLVIDEATDTSFGLVISGTGTLTKTGSGTLTLTGNNSFSGGTTITSGRLIGNTQTLGTGNIVNNSSLVFDQGTAGSFGGGISGTGSLTKTGSGTLTLTGVSSFTGVTTISSGTLIGSSQSLGTGNIVNNTSLVFDQGTAGSFGGGISGTGSLTKTGSGAVTLTGVNSFSGGTTISAGTLIGSSRSFGTGAIVNNASLVIDEATDTSFGGAISGTGSLTKAGAGALTLTGVSSFTGTTTVTAGRLNVRGSLARSALTLQSGSSLGGNGTVGSLTAQSGSTVSPGNSIGTLAVNGNLTLAAGSLLVIEASPSGSDMVTVTGTANLAGNLTVTPSAGQYSFFQRFTLVSANTLTGTFANSSFGDFGAKFRPKLMYDATSVVLRLDPNSLVDVSGGTLRGNALAFATAFDTAVLAGYNPDQFANLYTQGADLAGALGQFTGERYSAERQAAMQGTHVVRDAAFAALNDDIVHAADTASESKYDGDTLTRVWMRAAGTWNTVKGDDTGSRYKTDQTGLLAGIDVSTGGFKLGGMVSQSNTDVNLYAFGQSDIESLGATVYAGYRRDTSGFAVGIGAGFASNNALGNRAITVPTFAQALAGKAKSTSLQYFAEASYDFAGGANTRIEPFARIARVELDSKAFAETGGSAALHGDKQSNSLTMTGAGVRGAHASANMTLNASIGWQRTSGDLSAPVNLGLSLIDTPFEVHSAAFDRNAVTLDTQASFRLSSHLMFGIGYNAIAGKNSRSHGARATIRYAF